jgi:CubicO group peptidase (beta-lactamase class C family)
MIKAAAATLLGAVCTVDAAQGQQPYRTTDSALYHHHVRAAHASRSAPRGARPACTEVAAFAEQVASAAVKAFNVTGLSLGVVCNHSTVYVGGFGFEDREQRVPATADTLYQVASNSKAFTAMVALQMAGEGRLSLDGPARDGE